MIQRISINSPATQPSTIDQKNNQKLNPREIADFFNCVSEKVIFIDTENRILWANKSAGESAGLPSEELKGHLCYQVLSGRKQICPDCPLAKACQTGQPQEVKFTSADGRIWLMKSNPVRDETGFIVALVEIVSEINP